MDMFSRCQRREVTKDIGLLVRIIWALYSIHFPCMYFRFELIVLITSLSPIHRKQRALWEHVMSHDLGNFESIHPSVIPQKLW